MYRSYRSGSTSSSESDDSTDDDRTTVTSEEEDSSSDEEQWERQNRAHTWFATSGLNKAAKDAMIDAQHTSTPSSFGIQNTELEFTKRQRISVLMVDSLDRDFAVFPLPTAFRLQLPRVYKNIEKLEIVQLKFMSGLYAFSASRANCSFSLTDGDGAVTVGVSPGNYTIDELLTEIYGALTTVRPDGGYSLSYSHRSGRVTITGTSPFSLNFRSGLPAAKQGLSSHWGLGWHLGFGGRAQDLTGSTSYTGTALPRLHNDYLHLQLNETEQLNTVDHTSPETLGVAQESWGQVNNYFGKLLLNNFGCYAQTFVEAPKVFNPALGRLDRLQFEWVDHAGRYLTAEENAESCEWHATIRITEIAETPTVTSSLTSGQPHLQREEERRCY